MTAASLAWKALVALSMALGGRALFAVSPVPRVTVGIRGVARTRALERAPSFRLVEPAMRQVAAWIAAAGGQGIPGLAQRLSRSGAWLGLSPEEAVALCVLCGAVGGVAGEGLVRLGQSAAWVPALVVLGIFIPCARVLEAQRSRDRSATRELPSAIDLLWLCMTAGLDFPAALRFATSDEAAGSALREELRAVLREIELGRTRVEALRSMEARLPCVAVRDFVTAVVQSEERGNPLAEVLRVQAEVLRTKRGVLAEEAAARASTLLVIPLVLLLGSVMLLLFGPLVAGGSFH